MALSRDCVTNKRKHVERDVIDLFDESNKSFVINESSMINNETKDKKKRKMQERFSQSNNNIDNIDNNSYSNGIQSRGYSSQGDGDYRLLEGIIRGMLTMETCVGPKGEL